MRKSLFKLFVDVDDVMQMHEKKDNWAYAHLREIRKQYNLKGHQRVSLFHFCEYEGLPQNDVLNLFKR